MFVCLLCGRIFHRFTDEFVGGNLWRAQCYPEPVLTYAQNIHTRVHPMTYRAAHSDRRRVLVILTGYLRLMMRYCTGHSMAFITDPGVIAKPMSLEARAALGH